MATQFRSLEFERLGHASVCVRTADGRSVYLDPWSDVLDSSYEDDADVIIVTHDDKDHYDTDAIKRLSTDQTVIAMYDGVDSSDLARTIVSLPYDEDTTVADIDVTTIPAFNRQDGEHVNRDGEPFHAEGEVIGVLLTLDGTTIYYPSDTDYLPVHESIRADVFLPPIGGHYTMDRAEAAKFAWSVQPDLVLPVHYDTFDAITTDAKAFASDLEQDGISVILF